MTRVYLDYNATAPLRQEARAAMIAAMDVLGNPSSVHSEGRAAKAVVEKAREQVAAFVGCAPQDVVFTSGATEGAAACERAYHLGLGLVSADIEHDAIVANRIPGLALSVDKTGRLDLERFDTEVLGAVTDQLHVLAIQAANSETGILQDVEAAIAYMKDRAPKLSFVTDAVQLVGKVPFAFSWSGVDGALISAHKFGGPKGAGAIIAGQRMTEAMAADPLLGGGGQEMGRRSGTENVIGIAGFGAAAQAAAQDLADGVWDQIAELRNILEKAIEAGANKTILVGKNVPRLPNTTCLIAPGWKGETQVMAMDLAGFAISAGSACSSGKVRASRVLQAMGYDAEQAACAIRISLGPATTEQDVLRFAETWCDKYNKYRARAA